MAAKETPLQRVKRLYGSKDKLVESLVDTLREASEETATVKERLRTVSNEKLLRLAEVSKVVRERYGSRDKLVQQLSSTLGKAKDNDYVSKLRTFSTAKLLDMLRSAERRSKAP
jgi:hypothetical protein